jgi:hypothetical protein
MLPNDTEIELLLSAVTPVPGGEPHRSSSSHDGHITTWLRESKSPRAADRMPLPPGRSQDRGDSSHPGRMAFADQSTAVPLR